MGTQLIHDPAIYKLGARPAVRPSGMRMMAEVAASKSLPNPPASVGWIDGATTVAGRIAPITNFGMDGNDQYGDCVFAGAAHMEQVWSTLTGQPFVPTTEQVLAEYSRLTGFNPADPNTDQGAVESDTWAAWQSGGLFGRKILGFVGVNPGSEVEVKQAVWFFGGSMLGLDLPISSQNQQVWDVPPGGAVGDGAPGSWGGHCTLVAMADPAGVSMVTWGAIKRATWAFMAAYCTEAYALLSPDWIERGTSPGGVPLKSLVLDLGRITHS